ncbi:MAG: hypothetical protein ACSLFQ_19865 [Thermoanaerobaculia bacterium]
MLEAFREGGWKALDGVHAKPPVSSEEVLRPDLYRLRVARGSGGGASPAGEPDGDELVRTVLGEFHWRFLLGKKAGEGWGSDRVVIRKRDDGATVMVDSTWDSPADAREFADAIGPLLEEKKAKNVRVAMDGARVLAAWGMDAGAIRKFVDAGNGRKRNEKSKALRETCH